MNNLKTKITQSFKSVYFIAIMFLLSVCFMTACQNSGKKQDNMHTHENGEQHTHANESDSHPHPHPHGSGDHAHPHKNEDPNKPAFPFLGMNGIFKMDAADSLTVNDARNPSRIAMTTTDEAGTLSRITFYDHDNEKNILASCGYEYIGSRPDPHYYPGVSKTSIWDIFEKKEDYSGDCSNYKYVISRSPHDSPRHMHLRYGNDVEKLLNMSNDQEDDKFNPWWASFIEY